MELFQIILTLILFILIIIPFGKYLYSVISCEKSFVDPVCDRVDNFIYKITGNKKEDMNWKYYSVSLIITNLFMVILVYVILRFQNLMGLNPNDSGPMSFDLSLNTVVSFITNTNLQNYQGEGISYLSQIMGITFLMFTSAASGFSVAAAFMRAISGKAMGNFFVDIVRITTRVLVPISVVMSLFLIFQGVPQTMSPNVTVNTIENKLQDIALGPVASLESIKHLGTNGGGFFNANSAHPFENPTPLTNTLEMLAMMAIPGALIVAFGFMIKNNKQAKVIFISVGILFVIAVSCTYMAEKSGNPLISKIGINTAIGNMEGKETRFGIAGSSLFTAVTTAFTTGSVNNMHDSLTPLGGMVALFQMMLNVIFGGKGVGFMNIIMYSILSVFIAGLMVGRTPEFLGKKIEGNEMKLIALCILIHPFIILVPTAFSLILEAGKGSINNPFYHGLTSMIYQFTTSAANNGSSFQSLVANNFYFNILTAAIMFLGRYLTIIILLAVAGSLKAKKVVPVTFGTFKTDNSQFVGVLIGIILIIGALTFFPALALGPIAEHLSLGL